MKVAALGSGSKGNAFLISHAGETIIVDAGFGARTIIKRAEQIGITIGQLGGVVVTHEHGDHARGAASMAKKFNSPILASAGTLRNLKERLGSATTLTLEPHKPHRLGSFALTACPTSHDAAEPIALVVEGPDAGQKIAFASDLGRPTTALKYLFREASCLVIESNYDEVLLRTGPYPPVVQQRIAGSSGHLSNRRSAQLVGELCHRGLQHVILIHLSDKCNTPRTARDTMETELRTRMFRGKLHVASQNRPLGPLEIEESQPQLELGYAG